MIKISLWYYIMSYKQQNIEYVIENPLTSKSSSNRHVFIYKNMFPGKYHVTDFEGYDNPFNIL